MLGEVVGFGGRVGGVLRVGVGVGVGVGVRVVPRVGVAPR